MSCVTLLYMIIYMKSTSCLILYCGDACVFGMKKDKHLGIPLIMDFMDLWYYLEILKMCYLTCMIWELIENFIDKK